ncbi:MAG: OmpA family protein [Schleiferiaceae bacterium]|jgi:hypothetical protein|nr:OmpA family protein [Schleiferiaceae bacterium]
MKKLLLLFITFFLAFKGFSGVQSFDYAIFFNSDVYELSEKNQQQLDEIISSIPNGAEFEIYIKGFTDDVGTNEYNIGLSERRALAVKNYMVSKGLKAKLINMEYYGEEQPSRPNSTENNRRFNRRVSVQLTTIYFNDLDDLHNELNSKTRTTFQINSTKQNKLEGKLGTQLLVDPGSFVDANGNPIEGEIEFELVEATQFQNFISHNLATISDGKMLVSGGMVQLKATQNGQELDLNENSITMVVPTNQVANGMELFTSETGENWENTGQKVNNRFPLNLPPYPNMVYSKKPLPVYRVDSSNYPVKPKLAKKPRELKTPRQEDYMPKIKWYQFLWKGKIERKANERYLAAMERYENRRLVYEKKMELYKRDKTSLIQTMEDYNEAVAQWNIDNENARATFYTSTEYLSTVEQNRLSAEAAQDQYEEDVKQWKEIKAEKVKERTEKLMALGISNENDIKDYVLSVGDLNWVNIDKFYKLEAKNTRTLTATDPDNTQEQVFVVFNNINSLLALNKNEDNEYFIENIPKNEKASLLAYKVIDGKVYVSYQPISVKHKSYKLKFEPKTYKELRTLLSKVNRA